MGIEWDLWASGVMGSGRWARAAGQTPAVAQWLPSPTVVPQGGVRLAAKSKALRHCSAIPHSLSGRVLVLQAARLCGAGSPGAAGWCERWLMASRSVLGPFGDLGRDKEDLRDVGRESWCMQMLKADG